MKVYVVETGERGEGGCVVGVFSSKRKAVTAALKVEPSFEGNWNTDGAMNWTNGCDWLSVTEHEIDSKGTYGHK